MQGNSSDGPGNEIWIRILSQLYLNEITRSLSMGLDLVFNEIFAVEPQVLAQSCSYERCPTDGSVELN